MQFTHTHIQNSSCRLVKPKAKDPVTGGNAHIIVVGNEKGGSGKSTTAMHLAIALLRLGYKVGTLDLDARQGTLSRYIENRMKFIKEQGRFVPCPEHMSLETSKLQTIDHRDTADHGAFLYTIDALREKNHFIIIDTPGSDTQLSRVAHSYADTIITPINDSFVDLDLLVDIDPKTLAIKGPSIYTKMVERQKGERFKRDGGQVNWIVMRNRLSHINAKNKQQIERLLTRVADYADFTLAPGFGERVVFRELFLKGLTLLDLKESKDSPLTLSQVTARQEVRKLIMVLAPEKLKGHAAPLTMKKNA